MIGIVTGLKAETYCWKAGIVHCEGPGVEQAIKASLVLIKRGVDGLVSFGLAGGLIPGLQTGTVIVANKVILPNGYHLLPHSLWRRRICKLLAILAPLELSVVTSNHIVATTTAKANLFALTGAGIVDMESGGVALCAMLAGLPFLVVRITSDPAERTFPQAALDGVSPDGYSHPLRVFCTMLRKPSQWIELLQLSRDSYTAFTMLYRVAKRAGADFAWY